MEKRKLLSLLLDHPLSMLEVSGSGRCGRYVLSEQTGVDRNAREQFSYTSLSENRICILFSFLFHGFISREIANRLIFKIVVLGLGPFATAISDFSSTLNPSPVYLD